MSEEATEAQQENAQSETPPVENTEAGQQNQADELPEWARKSLEKANKEAANYRTQLREAQEALTKAKSPEDFEAVTAQLAEAQRQLTIREHTEGIPADVVNAEWVNWPSDADGIKKTAESLRAFVARQPAGDDVPTQGGQLQGGLNPQTSGTQVELNPDTLARQVKYFRNRR